MSPFPRRLLGDGEVVVLDVRPHWSSVMRPALALAASLALALVVDAQVGSEERYKDVLLLPVLIIALVFVLWFLARYVRWASSSLVVTTERVVIRTGVAPRRGREVPLAYVRDVGVRRTLGGRLLGSGSLVVESDEGGREVFPNCPRALRVADEVCRLAEAATTSTGPGAAGGAESPLDQLERLDDLRRRGAISEAEFDAKKAQLLDRL